MKSLETLIQELCPDGVEYVRLGEVCEYPRERICAKDIEVKAYISVENLLKDKRGRGAFAEAPQGVTFTRYEQGDILIGNIRPYLRKIWRADRSGGVSTDVLCVRIKNGDELTPEYLYYILSSERFFEYDVKYSKGAKMPRGDKSAVMNFEIPLPPLEIQAEIVRILDKFTELEAELEARKRQYEYYRDRLLTFDTRGGGIRACRVEENERGLCEYR